MIRHIYVHKYIRTYIQYINTYTHTHIYTYTHTHIHPYTHTHIPTYIHTYTNTDDNVRVRTYEAP
jgi:hypothetical protein